MLNLKKINLEEKMWIFNLSNQNIISSFSNDGPISVYGKDCKLLEIKKLNIILGHILDVISIIIIYWFAR
jgi:hypothetical protein